MYDDLTTDMRGELSRIKVPVTVLYPVQEGRGAAEMYRSAFAGTSQIAFVPVPDSAHFIMLDQPVAFAAALRTFLAAPVR